MHSTSPNEHSSTSAGHLLLLLVRYGIGAVMVAGGIVTLMINPAGFGVDGFAMAAGGGLSVLLINCMYRLSLTSEDDRAQEERARAYFDQHGNWPDDNQDTLPKGLSPRRQWKLAPGVVTLEDGIAAQAQSTAPARAKAAAAHA